jgi:hypothetical protein
MTSVHLTDEAPFLRDQKTSDRHCSNQSTRTAHQGERKDGLNEGSVAILWKLPMPLLDGADPHTPTKSSSSSPAAGS